MSIGRMRRRYAKGMMKKLTGEGSFVSDEESASMRNQQRGNVAAGLNAQSMQLNQMAQAQGRGGPMAANQFAGAQQGIAEAQAGADVQAEAAAQQQERALQAQREGVAMSLGKEMHDINRQNLKGVVDTGMQMGAIATGQATDRYESDAPVRQVQAQAQADEAAARRLNPMANAFDESVM